MARVGGSLLVVLEDIVLALDLLSIQRSVLRKLHMTHSLFSRNSRRNLVGVEHQGGRRATHPPGHL